MVRLKANNRALKGETENTYVDDNYSSGQDPLNVTSIEGFSQNDFILIGPFGSETSEIIKIDGTPSGGSLPLASSTSYAHPESTLVTKLDYNEVQFLWTSDSTFDTNNPLKTIDIDAQDFYTRYRDTAHDTGYGWFRFYNSDTDTYSSDESNAIPYADFGPNTVKSLLDTFFSTINQEENSQVDQDDALNWLNEAHAKAVNHLNMINEEYKIEPVFSINVKPNQQEYDLPTDFWSVESIVDEFGDPIEHIAIEDVLDDYFTTFVDPHYYLRGQKIGFVPTPVKDTTYEMYYKSRASQLTSLSSKINLPNNNFYFLVDWMLYRAGQKLGWPRTKAQQSKKDFYDGINEMKQSSIKQNENKDQWGIAREAAV